MIGRDDLKHRPVGMAPFLARDQHRHLAEMLGADRRLVAGRVHQPWLAFFVDAEGDLGIDRAEHFEDARLWSIAAGQ